MDSCNDCKAKVASAHQWGLDLWYASVTAYRVLLKGSVWSAL